MAGPPEMDSCQRLVGDEAVRRHRVVHDYCAHRFSSSPLGHSPPILPPPGASGLVRNQSADIGPLSGGNPCSAGNRRRRVFRRGVAGEVLELPAEVGPVEVARLLGELWPVDRARGVHGQDQPRKAVDPRYPLRGDPDMRLELRGQVIATDAGGSGQRTAARLGVALKPDRCAYDLVIAGGGPAGWRPPSTPRGKASTPSWSMPARSAAVGRGGLCATR
jgi:hypothetical protein